MLSKEIERWLHELQGRGEADPLDAQLREFLLSEDRHRQSQNELGFHRLQRLLDEQQLLTDGPVQSHTPQRRNWFRGVGFAACLLTALGLNLDIFHSGQSVWVPVPTASNSLQFDRAVASMDSPLTPISNPGADADVDAVAEPFVAQPVPRLATSGLAERATEKSAPAPPASESAPQPTFSASRLVESPAKRAVAAQQSAVQQKPLIGCQIQDRAARVSLPGHSLQEVRAFYRFIGQQPDLRLEYRAGSGSVIHYQRYGARILELSLHRQFGLRCPLQNTDRLHIAFPVLEQPDGGRGQP